MANLVYDYIAQSNPALATRVLTDFGYTRTKNSQGLGNDLRILVSEEGEPALERIMQIHPDKEIIIDLFSPKTKAKAKKCTTCESKASYLNASGPSSTHTATTLSAQGNTFILAAALMLAVAIIVKK